MLSNSRAARGQMAIEMAFVIPILLLFILTGSALGLSVLTISKVSEAAGNAAAVAARTDACVHAACPGPNCPSQVITAAQNAVAETLAESPYQNGSSANNNLYGVVPNNPTVTLTCPDGFYRSYNPSTGTGNSNGTGTPAPITVTLTGTLVIGFLPMFNSFNFSQSSTAIIYPYRSRSS